MSAALPPEQPASEPPSRAATQLEFLEKLAGGKPERVRKYLDLYLDSIHSALPRIEAALAAGDLDELRRVVHTVKPQFRMLGMEEVAQLAQHIENQAKGEAALDGLAENVERLVGEMRESVAGVSGVMQGIA